MTAPADPVAWAGAFVRLLQGALEAGSLSVPQRAHVVSLLAARTGLPRERLEGIPELAPDQAGTGAPLASEVRVLAAHFGAARAEGLGAVTGGPADLASFAERADPADVLLLLGAIVELGLGDAGGGARVEAAADALGVDTIVLATVMQGRLDAMPERRFTLTQERVTIGRAPSSDLLLEDPRVGPLHAEILREEGRWKIVSLDPRPVVVDGVAVSAAHIKDGARLGIGPYELRLEARTLVWGPPRPASALRVEGLVRRLGETVLLDEVGFTAFAGEVIALVGPSGAGKTTLIDAISGVAPADGGRVLLDGQDFHALLQADPTLIGEVPQDDLVLPELTVEESLACSGLLRAPASRTRADVAAEVNRVLAELRIEKIRDSRIGSGLARGVSGGQRKRVNLGQVLMAPNTRVLFLDEPTSGLDPRAAHGIARLARRLADRGRVVFLVTHDLTPQVLANVDQLLVLAPGGRLVWYGPPADGCAWFEVPTPDALFDRLDDRSPERWKARYLRSPAARRYVALRALASPAVEGQPRPPASSPLRALGVLSSRYWKVKVRDPMGALVMGVQPVALGLVMTAVFDRPTAQLVFMLQLSCLWLGMSAAVRELIVDRAVWMRERRVGVGVGTYLASKAGVLGAVTAAQSALLAAFVFAVVPMASGGFALPGLAAVSVLTGWAGMTLGLLVSAAMPSAEAAAGLLVLLLVPQIAFSGVLVPLGEMSAPARAASWLTVQRYALEAALRSGETLEYFWMGKWDRRPVTGDLFLMGLRPPGADVGPGRLRALFGVLGLVSALQLFGAYVLVAWRGRRRRAAT